MLIFFALAALTFIILSFCLAWTAILGINLHKERDGAALVMFLFMLTLTMQQVFSLLAQLNAGFELEYKQALSIIRLAERAYTLIVLIIIQRLSNG